MTAIETKMLCKKYGEKYAVRDLELTINQGEVFALLGTNGAGKTTTVKLLSTLLLPTSGSVLIGGRDIWKERMAIRQKINVSPQETAIAPNLTVLENLEFMAGVYGIREKQPKIDSLIAQFGLAPVLKQKGKTLSGGWQRKLSIALALVNDPEVLFLDEPTLGLDVLARRELWQAIRALRPRSTVILTTHYMEEAESLSDRVGIMNDGKLIAVGTAAELKALAGKEKFEDAFTWLVSGGAL